MMTRFTVTELAGGSRKFGPCEGCGMANDVIKGLKIESVNIMGGWFAILGGGWKYVCPQCLIEYQKQYQPAVFGNEMVPNDKVLMLWVRDYAHKEDFPLHVTYKNHEEVTAKSLSATKAIMSDGRPVMVEYTSPSTRYNTQGGVWVATTEPVTT